MTMFVTRGLATVATGLVTAAGILLAGTTASAATVHPDHNDSFTVYTTDHCGAVEYIDDGDTYKVHDYCADGHGVEVLLMVYRGDAVVVFTDWKYNGNGSAGAAVSWNPHFDILGGDEIYLEVALVDGADDTSWSKDNEAFHTCVDG